MLSMAFPFLIFINFVGGGGINLQFLKAKEVVRFKHTANKVSKAGRPRTHYEGTLGTDQVERR